CADAGYFAEHVDILQGLVYFFMQIAGNIAPHTLHGCFFLHTLAIQPVQEGRCCQQQKSQEPPGAPERTSYKNIYFFDMRAHLILTVTRIDSEGVAARWQIV